jgi:formate--tetrahydrofolate ligase
VDPGAVRAGLPNLDKHIENIRQFGEVPVVALNRFADDDDDELAVVRAHCDALGVPFAVTDHHARGGEGAMDLARTVMMHAQGDQPFTPLYGLNMPVRDKILTVARRMYGADRVAFTTQAERDLADIDRLGHAGLPVCIAKTPASLSDDPSRRGRPAGFTVTVRAIQINAGAGFLVVLTGDILRMPGLPRRPLAEHIDVQDGEIVGLA